MAIADVIHQIDAEIAKLQQAKVLLGSGTVSSPAVKGKRGRPKGSTKSVKVPAKKITKRTLSPEARAKIAAAQKARWAKAKKS